MLIVENIILALAGLRANKMRSLLTMLGIVIGISSVIIIMTVGDSINNSVVSSMGDMGLNKISVGLQSKQIENEDYDTQTSIREKDKVTDEMLSEFQKAFQNRIEGIALSNEVGSGNAKDNSYYANVNIIGINTTALKDKKLTFLSGGLFGRKDQQEGKKVALVSDKFVNNMFQGDADAALGEQIEVSVGNKFYSYTIVGVYQYKESAYGFTKGNEKDMATDCYLPLKTVLQQSRADNVYEMFDVVAKSGEDIQALTTDIANYFNTRYYSNNDNYEIGTYNMDSMVAETKGMINKIKMAIAAIAGISLLVGGIGVMNIMIVSITERTREIGTRKALGATNGSIRLQFIMEAVVICIIGGMIGVALGLSAGFAIVSAMGYVGRASVSGILICILFSAAFGIFFGYYPANRAAGLDPIEALRYE